MCAYVGYLYMLTVIPELIHCFINLSYAVVLLYIIKAELYATHYCAYMFVELVHK